MLLFSFEVTKDICAIEERMRTSRQLQPTRAPAAATSSPNAGLISRGSVFGIAIASAPAGSNGRGDDHGGNGAGNGLNNNTVNGIMEQSPIMSWQPNWYTQHRHWSRSPWLLRLLSSQLLFAASICAIGVPLSNDDTCRTSKAIGQNMVFSSLLALIFIEGIGMGVLSCKLAKHDNDGFGRLPCLICPCDSHCNLIVLL
jgi:hypothetical protein